MERKKTISELFLESGVVLSTIEPLILKISKLGTPGLLLSKTYLSDMLRIARLIDLLDKESKVIVESRDVEFFGDKFSEDAKNSDKTLDTNLPDTSQGNWKTLQRVEEPRRM
ncbi:hypothetical protein OSB04_006669 [Centaurea solstitialis]|uniref:Uncharacterized protein n=1 Tax=Centaurea solstitialis TaxID=347529 RepID=A0AA38TIE2_9ASTR|nr:hypothetical protein OSB04_006669 [Centaurea solstitialis]